MTRAKILILSYELTGGGAERVTEETARCLRLEGYEVVLCGYPRRPVEVEFLQRMEELGTRVIVLPGGRNLSPWTLWRVLRTIRGERPDVLHTHVNYQIGILSLAKRLYGSPKIVYGFYGSSTASGWMSALFHWGRRHIDAVICASLAMKALAQRSFPAYTGRIIALYSAYSPPPPLLPPRDGLRRELGLSDCRLIGTVARLSPEKGQKTILEALPQVLAQVPNVHFVFAGDGPLRGELEALANAQGVEDHVHFLGWRTDVHWVLRGLEVFVHPSLREALGGSIIEAASVEVPAVVTDVEGQKEAVLDGVTGLVVPPEDPQALAQAITNLLQRPDDIREMGRRAREYATRVFSFEAMQKRYAILMEALLKGEPLRDLTFIPGHDYPIPAEEQSMKPGDASDGHPGLPIG